MVILILGILVTVVVGALAPAFCLQWLLKVAWSDATRAARRGRSLKKVTVGEVVDPRNRNVRLAK